MARPTVDTDKIVDMDKIVSLCKRRGFVFPSSEIYGGFSSTWDYGPLGSLLKNNVKAAWIRNVVQERDDWSASTLPSSCTPWYGGPPATSRTSPIRWLTASPASSVSVPTMSRATDAPTAAAS